MARSFPAVDVNCLCCCCSLPSNAHCCLPFITFSWSLVWSHCSSLVFLVVQVMCYTHYPTISTDMIAVVRDRKVQFKYVTSHDPITPHNKSHDHTLVVHSFVAVRCGCWLALSLLCFCCLCVVQFHNFVRFLLPLVFSLYPVYRFDE